MRELSVMERRDQAVLAVFGEGEMVKAVAARFGVSRHTMHAWLATRVHALSCHWRFDASTDRAGGASTLPRSATDYLQ